VDLENQKTKAAEADARIQPQMPLLRPPEFRRAADEPVLNIPIVPAEPKKGKPRKHKNAKQPPEFKWVKTQISRQVRAVHGQQHEDGEEELWLYVPEHKSDKSNHKRKGWWLSAQPGQEGHYYIGELEHIQKGKKDHITDVACFEDFPFTRAVQVDPTSEQELAKSVRCVTSRPLTNKELASTRDSKENHNSDDSHDDDDDEGDDDNEGDDDDDDNDYEDEDDDADDDDDNDHVHNQDDAYGNKDDADCPYPKRALPNTRRNTRPPEKLTKPPARPLRRSSRRDDDDNDNDDDKHIDNDADDNNGDTDCTHPLRALPNASAGNKRRPEKLPHPPTKLLRRSSRSSIN
jgi:hypothetical protein